MLEIENRMVVDSEWQGIEASVIEESHQKPSVAGWLEIGTGIFIPKELEYEHAVERISLDEDLKREFVEWFYSGNWIKED